MLAASRVGGGRGMADHVRGMPSPTRPFLTGVRFVGRPVVDSSGGRRYDVSVSGLRAPSFILGSIRVTHESPPAGARLSRQQQQQKAGPVGMTEQRIRTVQCAGQQTSSQLQGRVGDTSGYWRAQRPWGRWIRGVLASQGPPYLEELQAAAKPHRGEPVRWALSKKK
jgi:hypothetical protein